MRAVVVGGGIGGLVAAVALRRRGWTATVVESAAKFGEVGAGVQLGPNATRVLARLGLDEELAKVAVTPEVVRFCRWDDDAVLTEWPVKRRMRERFGAPYYTLYRPDLIEVLARAQPADQLLLGARVTGMTAGADGATVSTVDGRRLEADLVLGCDGIHSTVRSATVGDVPARFSGMCAYRALVPADGTETKVRIWLGPGRHLVAYSVGRYLNLVGVVPAADWRTESWIAPGDADDLRRHYAGWSATVAGLLDRVDGPVYRWALYDREPLPEWVGQTTALLGDACHPMLPFLAQGAAQAIEDAGVLAECLEDHDVPAALERYQRLRLPKASRIQRMSWDNNTAYHLPDGPEQHSRDEAMRRGEAFALDAVSWIFEETGSVG